MSNNNLDVLTINMIHVDFLMIVLSGLSLSPVTCDRGALSSVTCDRGGFDKLNFQRQVEDFIEAGRACHDNPGLSVSVVKDGEVLFAKGFGHKSLDQVEPVTNETLFGIASLSKAFAATLILKQIEENKTLSLSTKVKDVLKRNDIFNDYLRSTYATLEDLLAHRLGIPSHNQLRMDDKLTRQNLVDRLKHLSPDGGFRTSFYYSNLMYGLLTHISEVIGGKSWEELVTEKILSPLNMTYTAFVTTANLEEIDVATAYQNFYGTLTPVPSEFSRRWGLLCGSGCILSNAVDMAKWMMFNLDSGVQPDSNYRQIIEHDLLEEAYKPQNSISSSTASKYYTKPETPVTLTNTNYGLGWRSGHYRGYPILTHTGSTYGYCSILTLIPAMKTGMFTAMSGDDPDYFFRTNMHLYMADLVLENSSWLDNLSVCSFPEPWLKKSSKAESTIPPKDIVPDRPLTSYEGLFSNEAYGNIEVYFNVTSGYLMASYGFAQFVLYAKPSSDQFYAQGYGLLENIRDYSTMKFTFDKENVVSLVAVSFETKDPPVFLKVYPKSRPKNNAANGINCGSHFCSSEVVIAFFVLLLQLSN